MEPPIGSKMPTPDYGTPIHLYRFNSLPQLVEHLRVQHGLPYELKNLSFGDIDGFRQWKTEIEHETSSSYVQRTGHKVCGTNTYTSIAIDPVCIKPKVMARG